MQRRQLLGLLAAAPLISVARAEQDLMPVAVNQTTIESGPLLIGNPPGIRVVRLPNGRAASAQLVGGQADAATGSETQATLSAVLQPQLRIILTLAECHYRMVGRRSAGIHGIADLRGKRIAYTPATSSEYFLRVMLQSAGLALADIVPVKLEPEAMPAALAQGQADAMAMWEPHPQNAINLIGKDAIVMTDPRKAPHAYFERFNLNTTTTVLNDPRRRAAARTDGQSPQALARAVQGSQRAGGRHRQGMAAIQLPCPAGHAIAAVRVDRHGALGGQRAEAGSPVSRDTGGHDGSQRGTRGGALTGSDDIRHGLLVRDTDFSVWNRRKPSDAIQAETAAHSGNVMAQLAP